ncbi:MAG: transposase [Verrucomicrobiae bacterium]|nr:transposase [Verrucomicrobiae bacterium]
MIKMYFNPNSTVEIKERHLPHWRQDGVGYFVTFRLADSIPQAKLASWKLEKESFLQRYPKPWSWKEEVEYHRWFTNQIESYLDRGMGSCLFCKKEISKIVANTLRYFDDVRYCLGGWVIMPNHVHSVITPVLGYELSRILHSLKSYSATSINELLGRKGRVWQSETYDQILRSAVHHHRVEEYIRRNPEKAGVEVHHASWLEV